MTDSDLLFYLIFKITLYRWEIWVYWSYVIRLVVVQLLSCVWHFATRRLLHDRLLCPPLSPGVCLNSCSLSWWCYLTISSSAMLFFCLQSFPASWSFPMSWLFTSHGQNTGASASGSVLSMNIQGWFPLALTGLISLQSKGLSRVFSNTTVLKHQLFSAQCSL